MAHPSQPPPKVRKLSAIEPILNKRYADESFVSEFGECFKTQQAAKDEISSCEVIADPFPCVVLPKFFEDASFLTNLRDQLLEHEPTKLKSTDLFQFKQSNALLNVKEPEALKKLSDFLYGDFLQWMKKFTGLSLTSTADFFFAQYSYTDVLLCHDDQSEDRRVAFIIYMTPPSWSSKHGGNLELFATDEKGHPASVQRSLLPAWNQLVFFEVSNKSFHQVSEVLTPDETRLSVGGWFHGPSPGGATDVINNWPSLPMCPPVNVQEQEVYEWVNPFYLADDLAKSVRKKFRESSELLLHDFLKKEKYDVLVKCLAEEKAAWRECGPANVK